MEVCMDLNKYIAVIDNYPKKGISFKDITPLIHNPEAFSYAVKELSEFVKQQKANVVVGPEARGFIIGAPVAYEAKVSFVPVRKEGKLPRKVVKQTYQLEYGTDTITMHEDAIKKGDRVVIIDDLIALGGTINATAELVKQLGGEVVGVCSLITLTGLHGITELPKKYPFKTLLTLSDQVEE